MEAIIRFKPGSPSALRLEDHCPETLPKQASTWSVSKSLVLTTLSCVPKTVICLPQNESTNGRIFTSDPPSMLGEECVGIIEESGEPTGLWRPVCDYILPLYR